VNPALEERIRAAYAAFVDGDLDTALADVSPEIKFINPEYAVETGTGHGLRATKAALGKLYDHFLDLTIDIEEILEGPDVLVVTSHWRGVGRTSGAPVDQTFTHVFGLSDGEVVTYRWFRTQDEGREAAGL
jgi:ketosteroid isomerase-like protein